MLVQHYRNLLSDFGMSQNAAIKYILRDCNSPIPFKAHPHQVYVLRAPEHSW